MKGLIGYYGGMPDLDPRAAIDLLPGAFDRFGDLVNRVPADRWGAPTPCAEWSVRDVVNHVTAEHLWVPHLLAGDTLEEVGNVYDGDMLGGDPARAWDDAAGPSRAAWSAAAPNDPVNLSMGRTPAQEYARQMLLDLIVHGWDLARGAGISGPGADPAAVTHLRDYIATLDLASWGAFFDAPVATDSDDAEEQLVADLGRDPAAWPRQPTPG